MKKVLYGERGRDEYGVYDAVYQAMTDRNIEMKVSLDPETIAECDAVILPGGLPDIDPQLYGEENCGSMNLDKELDELQMAVAKAAIQSGKPVLAICRGMQLVNICLGGTGVQDLNIGVMHTYVPNETKLHPVINIEGTLMHEIYGNGGIVNSLHHQAIKRLGKGLKVSQIWLSDSISNEEKKQWIQTAAEGVKSDIEYGDVCVVEGFVHESLPILGVEWHPELMYMNPILGTLDAQKLFDYFAEMF